MSNRQKASHANMAFKFDPNMANEYYDKWIKLGWAGTGSPYQGDVDPERLIIETTHIGRYEGRLFKAMLTWIREYHDLINIQRLLHFKDDADSAVLGAALEIAIENGATNRLQTIINHCTPNRIPEVLFNTTDEFGVFERNQKEFAKKEYLKWGLYCTTVEFYDDAMQERKTVLANNPVLALRALFGPNIRSEIALELRQKTKFHISGLAKKIGYAYSAVYNEVAVMTRNGFLTIESFGKVKVISMNDSMVSFLGNIPVK